ncbi:hypothetical protein DFR37_104226 [Eoetvoesiella caeni]|uniref:Uncharacterized protein n=1 Tax=Eoetvoesiella caeni TaxID=645616 RepID=A0A366HCJ2_9BURK|nr:hypothetical protein DFR37_104226 [Eoetvoesiella caeni]
MLLHLAARGFSIRIIAFREWACLHLRNSPGIIATLIRFKIRSNAPCVHAPQ